MFSRSREGTCFRQRKGSRYVAEEKKLVGGVFIITKESIKRKQGKWGKHKGVGEIEYGSKNQEKIKDIISCYVYSSDAFGHPVEAQLRDHRLL